MVTNAVNTIKIWDWPTRLTYFLSGVCFVLALFCWQLAHAHLSSILTIPIQTWHAVFSFGLFGLIIFRLIWGLFGSYYARFAQFIKGPRAIKRCLVRPQYVFGHTAVGGILVLLMLLACLAQVTSGLFTAQGFLAEGNLAGMISNKTRLVLDGFRWFNTIFIFILVALHIITFLIEQFQRKTEPIAQLMLGTVPFSNRCSYAAVHVKEDAELSIKAVSIAIICFGMIIWLSSVEI